VRRIAKLILAALGAALLLFLLIQLVPYGRDHTNPPLVRELAWDSVQTEQLARRACYDCHSNETAWPWYSNVAPVSWLLQRHVVEGRAELNFSEWGAGREGEEAEELAEVVLEGGMPPRSYLLLHPEAILSRAEKEALAQGLAATAGGFWQPGMDLEVHDEEEDD
jgi:hypothetical protein